MQIQIKHENDLVISVKGRLDTVTSAELDEAIKKEEIKETKVIMDFAEVEYISSAGLRVLLSLKKKLDESKKELEIHNINDVVREIFGITGFINALTVK